MELRVTFLLLLAVAPARLFLAPAVHGPLRAPAARPAFAVLGAPGRSRLPMAMEADEAYRMLGITEDATYDEITAAHDTLTETYAGDVGKLSSLDVAKDKVVDTLLQRRMAGAAAQYEGSLALEDRKAPPKTPIWELANNLRKKTIIVPSWRYALQVIGLMGGLVVAAWVAPSTASTTSLINTVSGMAFMYNRGEAEVPKDDFGQIGEIRPMKPKPFALTCSIAASAWLFASLRTNQMLALMAGTPPRGLALILRTSFVSLFLIVPALFVRIQGFFD